LALELAWVPKPLLFKWLTMTRRVSAAGVAIGAVPAEDDALVVGVVDVAVDPGISCPSRVRMPTSMPRSSLPSMSMMWSKATPAGAGGRRC